MLREPDDGNTHAYAATIVGYLNLTEFRGELKTLWLTSRHPAVQAAVKAAFAQMDVATVFAQDTSNPRRLTIDLGADGKAQIEVTFVPDEREVMVGEPLHLTFTVHNLSDIDLQAVQGFDQIFGSGPRMYYIRVVDGKGRVLPDREEPSVFSVQYNPEQIPAKGTWVHRLFLPEWARLTALGDYPYYHKPGDTIDKIDFDRMARVVRGLDKMVVELVRVE
jgi:hypothetical protein